MLRKPIGVWFSLALVIAIASGFAGYAIGRKIFSSRHRARQLSQCSLDKEDQERLIEQMSELGAIEMSKLFSYANETEHPNGPGGPHTFIGWLQAVNQHTHYEDVRQVAAMNLAMTYERLALTEEKVDPELKRKYLSSAQALLRGLGWTDTNESTLQAVAKREIRRWTPSEQKAGSK